MPQTYIVQENETLWGIAQKKLGAGSRWKELGGYTGRPEDLPVGTVLTIPGLGENLLAKAKTLGYVKGKSPEELAEIGTQLGAGPTAPTAPTTLEDIEKELLKIRGETPGIQTGIYGLAGAGAGAGAGVDVEVGVEGIGAGVGAGVGAPTTPITQDFSKIWEIEYGESGLEDVKTNIAGIDTEITNRKATRDQALLDEKGKPIPQWMITGRKALEIEAATGDLNRLIDQRNTLAGQYNVGISEVERNVGFAIDYQQELQRQLEFGKGEEQWEREFGLKLAEAGRPEALKTQVVEVGGRKVLVNTQTGEVIQDLGPVPAGAEYTPPTSYKEWELAGSPGTFAEWLAEKTPEETANEIIKKYFDYGKTRKDVEDLYKEAEKPIPLDIEIALDKYYGKKKVEKGGLGTWLKEEILGRMPGVKG